MVPVFFAGPPPPRSIRCIRCQHSWIGRLNGTLLQPWALYLWLPNEKNPASLFVIRVEIRSLRYDHIGAFTDMAGACLLVRRFFQFRLPNGGRPPLGGWKNSPSNLEPIENTQRPIGLALVRPVPYTGRRKEVPMTDLKKRILETLGRLAFYVAPQLFRKPYTEQLSSTTVTETRKTQKTRKTKQRP